ncbi:hypothetical protein F0A17_13700 [Billgrantia pellis]|uniref:Uncharacterized protein n=1 Tax=Billgrantia pellis TaxID=2606936 RepID=A0A7V7FY06_9GAMM|nr:hypothetical protein [Halomonas pellis]KAA0011175.1 hypothetical protein F0A17_13700 [Halomonas pellis]
MSAMLESFWFFLIDKENYHFLRLASGSVTWILILGGWFVVNKQNNSRELRKELRSVLDAVRVDILDLSAESVKYHTEQPGKDEDYNIVMKFKRINRRVNRLPLSLHDRNNILNLIFLFKKAVTLRNFETSKYERQAKNSQLVGEIEHAVEEVLDEIEHCFSRKFK